MQIENHPPRTLAYIRVTGAYGANYEAPTNRLYQWAEPRGLAIGECLYIYWDNPETTPKDKCRTVTDPVQYSQYWQELIAAVIDGKLALDDSRPCFELYHSYDAASGEADVSFCAAV